MKVALVILHADSARGGAERYTVDLAAALARRGHDVRVIATRFSDEIAPATRVALPATALTRSGRYRKLLHALDAHLSREKYDIVHAMLPVRSCDVYHPHAGMAAESMAKRNRLFNLRRRLMATVERELLLGRRLPVVLALSEYVKKSIRKHYTLAEERLVTLFNAVDLNRFTPGETPTRDDVNALFIGQDFGRKGLMSALSALAQVRWNPPCDRLRLTVIGRGGSSGYEAWAQECKVTERVTFLGPTGDPRAAYTVADFFILPTKHDPCSLVVLEALAMGVPVISTKFNGATEIMTDGVHGYVLDDPNDVDALAEAMRKMMDPQRRAAMSAACLALRPMLSSEHHLDQLEAIYRQVIERRGNP